MTRIVDDSDPSCFRSCTFGESSIQPPYTGQPAVFFRLELSRLREDDFINVEATPEGGTVLKPGRYMARFSYFAPHPEDMNAEDHFYVAIGASASLERREIVVYPNTRYKPEEIPFEIRAKPSTIESSIQITRKEHQILAPFPTIAYNVKASLSEKIASSSRFGLSIFVIGAILDIFSIVSPPYATYLLVPGTICMSLGAAILGRG